MDFAMFTIVGSRSTASWDVKAGRYRDPVTGRFCARPEDDRRVLADMGMKVFVGSVGRQIKIDGETVARGAEMTRGFIYRLAAKAYATARSGRLVTGSLTEEIRNENRRNAEAA